VAGDGYRIRLPRAEGDGDPAGGWLIHEGTAMVGSRAMMDDGLQLAITVPGRHRRPSGALAAVPSPSPEPADAESTLLPLYLDPMTKLFLVALMWCRPWLLDPSAASPLPRTPEIARAALEVTGAHHELERFDGNPEFRDRLSARVAEHLKVLRRKIADRGLAGADVRLSDEVAVRVLIEHGVVSAGDLRLLADPAWCSRQEDLWWTRELGRAAARRRARRRRAPRHLLDGRLAVVGIDQERGVGAEAAGGGGHHLVGRRRDWLAVEEDVALVDHVVERPCLVRYRVVGGGDAAHRDRDRLLGHEADAVDDEGGVVVAEGLADADIRCALNGGIKAARRRNGCG
jgi:hypothetical protein